MSQPTRTQSTHTQVIHSFFTAYGQKNLPGIEATLAQDIVWRIPGRHVLAGEKRGISEVLAFFDQLGRAGFQAEPLALAVDGDYVLDYHRGWTTAGTGLDLMWTLVFRFKDGKIQEVTNFSSDQYAADLFFNHFFASKS